MFPWQVALFADIFMDIILKQTSGLKRVQINDFRIASHLCTSSMHWFDKHLQISGHLTTATTEFPPIRVQSSDIEPQLMCVERSQLRWFWHLIKTTWMPPLEAILGNVQFRGKHEADPERTRLYYI